MSEPRTPGRFGKQPATGDKPHAWDPYKSGGRCARCFADQSWDIASSACQVRFDARREECLQRRLTKGVASLKCGRPRTKKAA